MRRATTWLVVADGLLTWVTIIIIINSNVLSMNFAILGMVVAILPVLGYLGVKFLSWRLLLVYCCYLVGRGRSTNRLPCVRNRVDAGGQFRPPPVVDDVDARGHIDDVLRRRWRHRRMRRPGRRRPPGRHRVPNAFRRHQPHRPG